MTLDITLNITFCTSIFFSGKLKNVVFRLLNIYQSIIPRKYNIPPTYQPRYLLPQLEGNCRKSSKWPDNIPFPQWNHHFVVLDVLNDLLEFSWGSGSVPCTAVRLWNPHRLVELVKCWVNAPMSHLDRIWSVPLLFSQCCVVWIFLQRITVTSIKYE